MALHPFAIVRFVVYGVLLFFSVVTLGLAANLVSQFSEWTFPGFAVAVSVLTIVSLVPLLVVDMIRRGSFISWVAIELAVFGVLWVLWLASAALSTSTLLFTGDCSVWVPSLASLCRQYSAVQAFSWLAWLLIKAYIILVLVLAILAMNRGHKRVWLGPSSDLSFSGNHTVSGESKIPPSGSYNNTSYAGSPAGQYPPGQYGQYPPQQPVMQQHTGGYVQQQNTGGYVQQQQGYVSPHQQAPGPGVAQV